VQVIPPKVVERLNALKIYCIPDSGSIRMAYYIIRSWGNYLFFPHPDVGNMYPFFKAQGGVSKVFDTCLPFPFYNAEIFTLFGASTVGCARQHHPDFLIERFGEEFTDSDLKLCQDKFELTQQQERLSFYDMNSPLELFQENEFSRLAEIK
jgi:hypothetical protein